jgi:hypothetical protein
MLGVVILIHAILEYIQRSLPPICLEMGYVQGKTA